VSMDQKGCVVAMAMLLGAPCTVTAQGAASHSSNIWEVVFARNDASVATVARGEVRIWSLPSGRLACRLDGSYTGGRVVADGESGFHVTLVNADDAALSPESAFRVDPTTCMRTIVPLIPGAARRYVSGQTVVRTPDDRILPRGFATPPDSRVMIRSLRDRYVAELPGGARIEGERRVTALDAGEFIYVCAQSARRDLTYHRVAQNGRIEKISDIKADRSGMAACGVLSLSVDSTALLDAGAGALIDLRRKKVLITEAMSQPTSMGADLATGRMALGHANGVIVYDLQSKREVARYGEANSFGFVSPSATWIALASSAIARPLVTLQSPRFASVELDDMRSRPGADRVVAEREAEVRERNERNRREQDRDAAEQAQRQAEFQQRVAAMRLIVEARYGRVSTYATLRQIQYQGAYDWIVVDLKQGDVVALASERDGVVTFRVNDGTRIISTAAEPSSPTSGFQIASTTLSADIKGNLDVQGRGGLVHVFIVRRADVRR
jgi:hypothetical protein